MHPLLTPAVAARRGAADAADALRGRPLRDGGRPRAPRRRSWLLGRGPPLVRVVEGADHPLLQLLGQLAARARAVRGVAGAVRQKRGGVLALTPRNLA